MKKKREMTYVERLVFYMLLIVVAFTYPHILLFIIIMALYLESEDN